MRSSGRKILFFLFAILAGVGIFLVASSMIIAPQITREEVGMNGGIIIKFPVEMNQKSVEEGVKMVPSDNSKLIWGDGYLSIWPISTWQPGTILQIFFKPGIKTTSGVPNLFGRSFQVEVREADVVFLSASSGTEGIWKANVTTGEREMLIQREGILEVAVSSEGEWIVASQENGEGGMDLWLYSRDGMIKRELTMCGALVCGEAFWEPYGYRIAYSQYDRTNGGNATVWVYDITAFTNTRFFSGEDIQGQYPGFSPGGGYFTQFSPELGGIYLQNLYSGETQVIQTSIPQDITWMVDESSFFFLQSIELEGQPVDKIYRYDIEKRESSLAFGMEDDIYNYGRPAWSPQGDLAAIPIRQVNGGLSAQIWLFNKKSEIVTKITNNPSVTHGGVSWSPDGKYLLIQSYSLDSSEQRSGLLLWNSTTGELNEIASNAFGAKWLP